MLRLIAFERRESVLEDESGVSLNADVLMIAKRVSVKCVLLRSARLLVAINRD